MSNRISVWRILRISLMTMLMLSLMLLAFGYFIGRKLFVVREQTFYFADLPAEFDGYRILQFSDLHVATFERGHSDGLDSVIALINRQKCDAIFFTGDIICERSKELDGLRRKLNKIKAPDGVYSVMGNHDYGTYYDFEKESDRLLDIEELQRKEQSYGWKMLLNEHVLIHRGNATIAVIGVENDGRPPFPSYANLSQAANGLTKKDFCVLLTHDPTHWRRKVVAQTSIQLSLSGHTHGGQYKFLGWAPCSLTYPEWTGTYVEGNQVLNVTDGVGCSLNIPGRFGAWPEINVITLKRIK